MAETKFLDSAGLTHLLEKTNAKFSKLGHTHTKAEITDFAHTHDDRYYTESEVDSKLNGKSNTGHTHDDRYYTESEMNTKLAGKSDTSHSHTTHLTTEIAASTNLNNLTTAGWYKCSASATAAGLTNCPTKNAFAMEVLSNAGVTQTVYEYATSGQKIYTRNLYDNTWGAWTRIYTEANKPTLGELGAAASSHTHNYAGSSSSGGSANSAVKLDSSAGSATQPVYFSGGKPVATTYTLGKSVPADAVFTDTNTHYASKNVVGSATATSNTTAALTNGNVYLNSVENGAVTSAHKISGSGATTVTTDTSGNIVVSSTNTTYSSLKNPYALTVSLNGTSQGAYDGSAAKSINVTPSSIGAYTKGEVDSALSGKAASSHKHAAADITSVNASAITGVIAAANLPSFVDDVLEGYLNNGKFYKTKNDDGTYATEIAGETGKIYVNLNDNKTYRWSGSAFVVISETIALGETSSTAYRGDRGKAAYDHATAKGSAFASGLYKITTNAQGHVTAATAVQKSDITGLGIPAQDTVYTHPTSSGNKHIPSGGAAGQFLKWSADGTAVWAADNNTTYGNFKGATTSAAGGSGLVPAPATGAANRYLRSDGTWQVPPDNNTWNALKGATADAAGSAGYVAAPAKGQQGYFLRGDATWVALSKGTVGLGNVDNTADSAKSVKYATSAGSASTAASATKASTADSATKATQDSAGQQINTTYIKGLSVSGRTVTYTRGDGTTGTITTQDTNTTYNALTNDEIDAAFAAVFG
jgi:hypothetical protein